LITNDEEGVDMVRDLGLRILLIVIGLFGAGLAAYDISVSGFALNVSGVLHVISIIAGIVLIYIGIFVKEVRRKN
jgi:cytochrome c biogenesis protein CcdA